MRYQLALSRVKNHVQKGFTLIELVIVIVIIGILAAVAIPRFLDLTTDAAVGATKGIAGALGSASATNYAIRSGNVTKGGKVADCQDVGGLLQGGLTPGYTIGSVPIANLATATCTLTDSNSHTATFIGHGIT